MDDFSPPEAPPKPAEKTAGTSRQGGNMGPCPREEGEISMTQNQENMAILTVDVKFYLKSGISMTNLEISTTVEVEQ